MIRERLASLGSTFLLATVLGATPLVAHEVRPGFLQLREISAGSYDVTWKSPTRGGMRMRMRPILPAECRTTTPVSEIRTPGALIERWGIDCGEGLVGKAISIDGLATTLTDVVVRIERLSGEAVTKILKPNDASFIVPAEPDRLEIAASYLRLGVEHILGGIDHLLFVLGLLLIVRGRWMLLKTITAFTVAHSITLAMAVLGFVEIPIAPVEAVISLSILFLASELAHSRLGRPGLAQRYPWVVAFTFGLLHGFGFAGALTEVGLPSSAIPLALFFFNVGVEVGQLMFVAFVLAVIAAARRFQIPWPAWAWRVPAYAIGSLAAFWTIQRVASFWGS